MHQHHEISFHISEICLNKKLRWVYLKIIQLILRLNNHLSRQFLEKESRKSVLIFGILYFKIPTLLFQLSVSTQDKKQKVQF